MRRDINDSDIVVWFSCGAASAVAAKKTLELYGPENRVRIVNNPVLEEHEDNLRFLKDVENWLGVKIEVARNEKFPSCSARDVWEKFRFMSGPKGAPCTRELKKEARYQFELKNKIDWHVLGFTLDETKRHERFVRGERSNVIPVLIDLGITKAQCMSILRENGIKPPIVYSLGFKNANCIGCVKSSSPAYWNMVRKNFPEVFRDRAEQSRRIGARLVRIKDQRIFLDELDKTDNSGSVGENIECGIFCQEEFSF